MPDEDDCAENSAAFAGSLGHYRNDGGEIPKCKRRRRRSSVIWPPDALTRLMMEADHVSEIALDSLLQRIARARAAMITPQTDCVHADAQFHAGIAGSGRTPSGFGIKICSPKTPRAWCGRPTVSLWLPARS
jgi:hypothetical protein